MKWFDDLFERKTRTVAQRSSRRGALIRIGKLMVGTAFVLPVLPFDRTAQAAAGQAHKAKGAAAGETDCDYWRFCALDGFLCACCGGSASTCPPGTEPSKVAWVGTCHNPEDGKDYLISYNDCCGKTACGRCLCNTNEREMPGYRMGLHNDINWCMANDSSMFHCTTGVVVGMADGS
ncbi:methylamine dehydrogenase light chain [Denitromonas ohlonensis]|jgi:methylamine dehydrogenase light chain|uniref:Amine dehydrogenase n=2 Tax=Denitromonas TaxID=139331 RepID=A0A558E8C9_9RHOO|nr:methylamine dehydrogenase light chain [Denitromonas ohlonensis]TVT49791.1 MAG: amine dehydrogenase [Denitromonas halophila]TVO65888.1 amine dehydrogenase [Denitromonas ohlonensis]TVO79481.1 amine dehydrogenase [Denitromonas ohlonensis]TVT69403.1 MAG: amine dehydrogenase [Denitromonas halophila]TVT75874.1 MAG: amine dehydrogenase [Denitromonas halophila]